MAIDLVVQSGAISEPPLRNVSIAGQINNISYIAIPGHS